MLGSATTIFSFISFIFPFLSGLDRRSNGTAEIGKSNVRSNPIRWEAVRYQREAVRYQREAVRYQREAISTAVWFPPSFCSKCTSTLCMCTMRKDWCHRLIPASQCVTMCYLVFHSGSKLTRNSSLPGQHSRGKPRRAFNRSHMSNHATNSDEHLATGERERPAAVSDSHISEIGRASCRERV